MIKKLFSVIIISLLFISLAYCQEEVIIKRNYEKFEYINEAKNTTTHDPKAEFFGWALIGTAYSSAQWKIMKIEYNYEETAFVIKWADGDTQYNNKMSEYPLYTYQ